jgi:hypothetical protein
VSAFIPNEKSLQSYPAIGLLQDSTLYLNTIANVYTFNLVAQERYGEALHIAAESEAVNIRYEEASKSRQPATRLNT